MKSLILSIALMSAPAMAAQKLNCVGTKNFHETFSGVVTLDEGAKNQSVGEVDEFEIILSSMGNQKIELQAYNPIDPSRTYSTGTLTKTGDVVEMAIWTREQIIEVKCSLL